MEEHGGLAAVQRLLAGRAAVSRARFDADDTAGPESLQSGSPDRASISRQVRRQRSAGWLHLQLRDSAAAAGSWIEIAAACAALACMHISQNNHSIA